MADPEWSRAIPALMSDGHMVTCCVEIENLTGRSLTAPEVTLVSGEMSLPPKKEIKHGERKVVVFHSRGYLHGSSGTLSWLIGKAKRRVVVMWSVPYFLTLYSNTLALGMTEVGHTQHQPKGQDWFDLMYRGNKMGRGSLRFNRQEYFKDVRPIIFEADGLQIEGSMSIGTKAHVRILVRRSSKDTSWRIALL